MSHQSSLALASDQGAANTELKLYARLLLRWSWLIVLCALLAAIAALVVSTNMTPVYRTSSQLMISMGAKAVNNNYADLYASERVAQTYAQLMASSATLERSLQRLGADVPVGDLARQITGVTVTPVRDTQLVNMAVDGTNPELIAAVANVLPQVFLEDLRQLQSARYAESKASLQTQLDVIGRQIETTQLEMGNLEGSRTAQEELDYGRLQNSLSRYQASYANLLQTYETLRLAEAQSLDNIVVMEPASVPGSPGRPRTQINVMLAAIIGAMAALGIIVLIEYLDDRIRTPDDVKQVTTLPVLGVISQLSGKDLNGESGAADLISATQPRNPVVEAYRRLRTNLRYYNVDRGLHSLVVTSANPGEGKSITAVNLAVVLAQAGQKVVLVDTDLRKPRLHRIFGLMRKPGLADLLASGLPIEEGIMAVGPTEVLGLPNLRVLVAGGSVPNPAELLGSQRMQVAVEYLKQEVDVVIFDSPPLLAVADAQVLGHMVDGTLLVINSQKTSRGDLQRAIEVLEQVNVPVSGVVLNRLSKSGRGSYYLYDYYYADSDADDPSEGSSVAEPVISNPEAEALQLGD